MMGSPTEPRMRSDARLYFFGHSGPNDCSERMAVGAVYSSETCADSPIELLRAHKRTAAATPAVPPGLIRGKATCISTGTSAH